MSVTRDDAPNLRTRARQNLRTEVGEVAFTVFAERGFDNVTATEVAQAAGISRASFFRYFESKEDAVFVAQEALGNEIASGLRGRPTGEDAWTALRHSLDAVITYYRASPSQALARLRLIRGTPKLRSHQLDRLAEWKVSLNVALAERLGLAESDVKVEALVAAALGALNAASVRWAESEGADDLVELTDAAFAALAEPFPALGAPPRP
jgi:AcrR family transcriptional regulator